MLDQFLDKARRGSRRCAKSLLRNTQYRKALYSPLRKDRPFLVRLDINNTCNLRCPNCFYPDFCQRGNKPHYLSLEEFRLIGERLLEYSYVLQLACSFEPLMHPQFPEIAKAVGDYGVPTVGMVTNGTMLEGARADAIRASGAIEDVSISINALEPSVYEKLHGRDMVERVRRNIENFAKARGEDGQPHIKVNCVITSRNLGELVDLMKWADAAGCDEVQFFHVQPFKTDNPESLANDADTFNRVRDQMEEIGETLDLFVYLPPPMRPEYFNPETGEYQWQHLHMPDPATALANSPLPEVRAMDPHPYPTGIACISPWMTVNVDCFGDMFACVHRTWGEPYSNILREPLYEAMNSMRMLKIRQGLLTGRPIGRCTECRKTTPHVDPMQQRVLHLEPNEKAN